MSSHEDIPGTDPSDDAQAGTTPTPDIDGDTLLRDVDTPHLRNQLQRRLFGRVIDPVRIARFPVLRRIGQGGMGVVYAAFDNELDRKVAIKLLRPGLGDDDVSLRDRLLREARALARLSHPSIVQVYEAGEHDGQVYLAMEFVEGHTLRQWCDAEERSVRELLDKFLQAGEGLAAAHAAGLVHRDFKPDNVIVGNDGRVRVLDFGLAMMGTEPVIASNETEPVEPMLDRLTRTGAVIGTPAYMAPEQFLGHPADARSDQFSFAVTLYEALFGSRPFAGETFVELRSSVVDGDLAPLPGRAGTAAVARALRRALLPDRERRYADVGELLVALRSTQRRRGMAFALVGAIVALGSTGLVVQQRNREAEVASLTAVVDSLGTEVQGERSRANDAEALLRHRADVLTVAEARFSARRDPSFALALLSRLSDDEEMWGPDTWSLAQRSAAQPTAREIVPIPEGQRARHLVLDGNAVILQDRVTEGSTLWWPWEDRRVVLADGRHSLQRIDERTVIVQSGGSSNAILWDLESGAPIAPMLDVQLSWSVMSVDDRKLLTRGKTHWSAVDLRTLERRDLAIPTGETLLFAGPNADWALTFDMERIDANGREGRRIPENKEGIFAVEPLLDGRFARLAGGWLQIWDSASGDHHALEFSEADAPTGMVIAEAGDRIALGSVNGRLVIVDGRTLATQTIHATAGRVEPKSWLAEDRLLFAQTPDGGVLVDLDNGDIVPLLQGREIDTASIDSEHRLVALSDGVVCRWQIDLDRHDDPHGRDLIAIDGPAVDGDYVGLRANGDLVRWVANEWRVVGRHVGATGVTIAAQGDRVVTGGLSGVISWSLATGESQRIRDRLDEVALIQPPIVDPSGRWLALHAETSNEIIDLRDGSSRSLERKAMCFHSEFAPDDQLFYLHCIGGNFEHLRRWNTETWQELPALPLSGHFLAIGPRGRLAVRERDRIAIEELSGATDSTALSLGFVTRARFSSDGRMLVGLASDGRFVLGDVTTGRVGHLGARLRFREQTTAERQAIGRGTFADERRFVFSRDGQRVIAVDGDGTLQRSRPLPPAAPDELRAWVRANAPTLPSSVTLDQLVPDTP